MSSSARLAGRSFARDALGQVRIFRGLERVLPALARAGVAVMPLKGILLAWTLYPRPEERALSDADILVEPAALPRAVGTLGGLGARITRAGTGKYSAALDDVGGPWKLDLHGRLWAGQFLRLNVEDAWRRSSTWPSPWGVNLRVPPREFTFVHVAAHFARDARTSRDERRAREVARLADWTAASPADLAAYASLSGATGTTYYALSAAAELEPGAARYIEALPMAPWRAAALRRMAVGGGVPHRRMLWPLLAY